MKYKYIALILFSFIFCRSFAQPGFFEGYFIDSNNIRTECLILTNQGSASPNDFTYKLYGNNTIHKAGLTEAKEFGIYNIASYIKATVNIDRSSTDKKNLSTNKNPEFVTETHFFLVLLEGYINLYSFEDETANYFFYSKNDSSLQQLIYKQYIGADLSNPDLGSIKMTNAYYQQQLFNELNCNKLSMSFFENINYEKGELKGYFIKENACRMGDNSSLLLSTNSMFEKGYFINNNDKRYDCLILNTGASNPLYFYYMIPGVTKLAIGEMDSVKEFRVFSGSHYVRARVNVDRSSQDTDPDRFSLKKAPEFSLETHYLKVLVDGYASLYYFEDMDNYRFFYSIQDSSIQPLVHKQYVLYEVDNLRYISAESTEQTSVDEPVKYMVRKVAVNNYFHQQLYNDVNCTEQAINKITIIGYNKTDLVNYFRKENYCRANQTQ